MVSLIKRLAFPFKIDASCSFCFIESIPDMEANDFAKIEMRCVLLKMFIVHIHFKWHWYCLSNKNAERALWSISYSSIICIWFHWILCYCMVITFSPKITKNIQQPKAKRRGKNWLAGVSNLNGSSNAWRMETEYWRGIRCI